MKRSIWWELLWDMAYLSCGNILNNSDDGLHASLKKGLKQGLIRLNHHSEFKLTKKGRAIFRSVIRETGWKKGPLILMMQAQRNGGLWLRSGLAENNNWLIDQKLARLVNEDLKISRAGRYMVNLAAAKLREELIYDVFEDVPLEQSGSGDGTTQRLTAA